MKSMNQETSSEEINMIGGDYLSQLVLQHQHETYTGFWDTLLNILTFKGAVIFRHMKNKQTFIDISLCDLIWIIALCSMVVGIGLSIGTYAIAKHRFEEEHHQYHLLARQYNEAHKLLPTRLPNYVRQISDIVPCRDYNHYIDWVLRKRFNTSTNYCYVSVRNGIQYLQEVSDEEYEKAVRDHFIKIENEKRAENCKRGQDLLKNYNSKKNGVKK